MTGEPAPCAVCGTLEDYFEIEYPAEDSTKGSAASGAPAALTALQSPPGELYGPNQLSQCSDCGQFFAWTRVKSPYHDPPLREPVREVYWRCSALDALLIVAESEAVLGPRAEEKPDEWRHVYYEHRRAAADFRKQARESFYAEIVVQAIHVLRKSAAPDSKFDAVHAPEPVARVLSDVLYYFAGRLTDERLLDIFDLLEHSHAVVRERILLGLRAGLRKIKNETARLRELDAALVWIGGASRSLRDAIDEWTSDLEWKEFMTDARLGGMFDEVLRDGLAALPGLRIVEFIPQSVTEAIIDFMYEDFRFRADNGDVSWTFMVRGDPPAKTMNRLERHIQDLFTGGVS